MTVDFDEHYRKMERLYRQAPINDVGYV